MTLPAFTSVRLKPLIWSKMWKILSFSRLEKCHYSDYFSIVSGKQEMRKSHLQEKQQLKINSLKKSKQGYIIQTWSDIALKGTIVNRTFPSLNRGSLETTLTVPLKVHKKIQINFRALDDNIWFEPIDPTIVIHMTMYKLLRGFILFLVCFFWFFSE